MSARMGRPTDNPKGHSIHIRLDEKSSRILSAYMEMKNVCRADAVRAGIEKLEAELKK